MFSINFSVPQVKATQLLSGENCTVWEWCECAVTPPSLSYSPKNNPCQKKATATHFLLEISRLNFFYGSRNLTQDPVLRIHKASIHTTELEPGHIRLNSVQMSSKDRKSVYTGF